MYMNTFSKKIPIDVHEYDEKNADCIAEHVQMQGMWEGRSKENQTACIILQEELSV